MKPRAELVKVLVRCSLALVLGAAAGSCLASPIGPEEACAVANGWYLLRFQNEDVREDFVGEPPGGFAASDARPIVVNGWVITYAFDTPGGRCIAIPAEDCFPPILFYSLENRLAVPAIPPAQAILESFAEQIAQVQSDAVSLSLSRDPLWDELAAVGSAGIEAPTSDSFMTGAVGPLVTSKWDQMEPYSDKCPLLGEDRCVVGCVATAMAQVMRYWKHPTKGTGSHCYFWSLGWETRCLTSAPTRRPSP